MSSVNPTTAIPMLPPPSHTSSHTNHLHPQPSTHQSNMLAPSDNNHSSRRHSISQLSSSAPSFSSFLSNPRGSSSSNQFDHSNRSSTASNRNSVVISASTMLAIEFEGGNQVIVRPNRIIRGKVLLNVSEKIHVTRIRVKVNLMCNT